MRPDSITLYPIQQSSAIATVLHLIYYNSESMVIHAARPKMLLAAIYKYCIVNLLYIELKLTGPMAPDSLNTTVVDYHIDSHSAWWRHQMEPFSALLALCAGN